MMITIHGLPVTTKYQDLKVLIKQECNISDFILDCLVNDTDGTKKVRVGLADDSEGSHLIKCLNGYRMSGNILRLIPVGKSAPANVPPQNSYDQRGNYQARNEYPSQGFTERNNRVVETRPTPWASSNQWPSSQPTQTQLPSSYSYQQHQQPLNTSYGQVTPSVKPQFESREAVPAARVPQNTQTYGYNPKSNLISLGPTRNIPSTLREIPEVSRPIQSSRYPNQNYGIQTDKPVTIMKDNFQGPSQYNVAAPHTQGSGNYQIHSQPSPWASHQPQKQFEKQSTVTFDKKPYDDRKYPQPNQMKPMPEAASKSEESYKAYDKSRQFSPQRRAYGRDMPPERRISPSEREISHTGRGILQGRRISPTGRQAMYQDRRSPGHRHSPERRTSPTNRSAIHSGRDISPSGRRISPSARHIPATGRRISPSGRRISPPGRRISPGRRMSPSGRRISPSGRRISPSGRRISPSGRRISPSSRPITTDRHISPHGRRFSPSSRPIPPVRQMSPVRKISPTRKLSPSHRRMSPQAKKEEYLRNRRISPPTHSPMGRRVASRPSPSREVSRGITSHGRQESPRRQERYSPSRHHSEKNQEYQDDRRSGNVKSVRPAYEPPSQASNEAIYSGGYRQSVREDAQYPVQRQDWQDREKAFPPKNIIEDRRDVSRLQKFDMQRVSDQPRSLEQESKRSRSRSSRSPRRERSPVRDRYRRHSPSPRSPRRSWALEKRRSPETREPPPPPVWPGQDNREDYSHQSRSKIHEREIEKHVWDTRDKKREDYSSADNRREFEEQIRMRTETPKWKPIPQPNSQESSSRPIDEDRMQKESKFVRKDFEGRHDYREDDIRKHSERLDKGYPRQERENIRYKPDLERKDDIPRKREEYSGRIEEKKKEILQKQEQLQKEIDEVYKRAVDFTKKAEMYRKGEHKKGSIYDSDRRRDEDRDPKEYESYKQDSYERLSRDDLRKEYPRSYPSRSDEQKTENIDKLQFDADEIPKKRALSPTIKAKRNKAIEEISEKMLCKYGSSLSSEIKKRVECELKWTLGRKLYDLFGDQDVSFIEMVVKFNARHNQKDEERIFQDVMSSLPSHYRSLKRHSTQDDSDVPAKSTRRSPEPNLNKERPASHREVLKTKFNPVPEKKRSVETAQSSDKKRKTAERDVKEEQRAPELNIEDEVPEEEQVDGQFELNGLMTRILEEELQTLMIEVWQALPDEPPTEAERFVAERLRNEVSDDLRNVLGLNVTKRLLNVYNPLFVKIRFSCRPESGCLTKFLDTYNVTGFKRINKSTNTFAARFCSITDFDNICSAKNIRCGGARITVTPFYRYTLCPKKLNTVFADKGGEVGKNYQDDKVTNELVYNKVEATKEKETKLVLESNKKDEKEKSSVVLKDTKTSKKTDIIESKEKTTPKNEAFEKVTPKDNKAQKDETVTKSENNSEKKPKIEETKEIKKVISPVAKPAQNTTKKEITKEKPLIPNKSTETKRNVVNNEVEVDESEVDNEFDEGDEMNDEEILALISSGVIVDECIGSDEE